MVTPIYPATNNQQAIDLNISNANQFFTILQGGIEDFIPTYEGNGEIPSVAKALNEAAAYKVPLPWQTTGEETDLLQPREFNDDLYVPLKVPAEFSTAPSNEFWRLYSEKRAQILIDNITLTGDGFTTDFNIPSIVVDDPAAYLVSIDGVDQRPTIDYTVNVVTDTLSFTEAPPTTVADNISVTILGALRGAIAEEIYADTADGLANTSDGQFFNVVNTTDPEAFIDLYRNNAGAALLIDTYPNSVAYNNLANAVAYEADLASNAVGDGSDKIAHTGTPDTVTKALDKRVIRRKSIAEIEALSPTNEFQVSLSGLRSGIFEFDSSNLSTEVATDIEQGIYIAPSSDLTGSSGAWVRQNIEYVTPEMYGAVGDYSQSDSDALQAALDSGFAVYGRQDARYKMTYGMLISNDNTKFYGNGCTLESDNQEFPEQTLDITGNDVIVQGVRFNRNQVVSNGYDGGNAIRAIDCDNPIVKDCFTENCEYGIKFQSGPSVYGGKMENNWATNVRYGYEVAGGEGCVVRGNVCVNFTSSAIKVRWETSSTTTSPTYAQRYGKCLIDGNYIADPDYTGDNNPVPRLNGIDCETTNTVPGVTIINNIVNMGNEAYAGSGGVQALSLRPDFATTGLAVNEQLALVANNQFLGGTLNVVHVFVSSIISNNVITGDEEQGGTNTPAIGILVSQSASHIITGNIIRRMSGAIGIRGDDVVSGTFENNEIFDCADGISLIGTSESCSIIGNNFDVSDRAIVLRDSANAYIGTNRYGSSVTTKVDNGTSGVVRNDDLGRSTGSRATSVSFDANGEGSIVHGLDTAPGAAYVNILAGDRGENVQILSLDSTNVNLHATDAAGGDLASVVRTVYWVASEYS